MAMKLEIIGKELIKPASPMPNHLRTLQLSLSDFCSPPIYVIGIFFYDTEDHIISKEIVSLRLKKSLSEILTRFYPLAGRVEGVSINCNDEGAVFMEARTDSLLSEFLRNPVRESFEQVVPSDISKPLETSPLLNVTVIYFRSGGLAIAVSISHKVFDASSLSWFVNMWATTARGYGDSLNPPEFAETTIFPPADLSMIFRPPKKEDSDSKRVCISWQRFFFDAFKIKELKRRAASETVQNPTRVEVVTTFIWKCATKAMRSNSIPRRPSFMRQAMDIRRKSSATYISENMFGNLVLPLAVVEGPESEMDITEVVAKLRKKKEEVSEKIREILQLDRSSPELHEKVKELRAKLLSDITLDTRSHPITSWCGFPFYEADFGWGRPVWFATGRHIVFEMGFTCITDTKDGQGIEAWVTLPEQDMLVFEHDPELLAVATPNPSVLV
ncbi:PREDICTED: BAHD acyltransferase At5g47980-like [Tarenaya hassleriana]|uniref:BAHD acyltransferase At5g47980-like n=1 Tax=Tarenaya hassleriana TaxID=28532 RepID=UPI00053C2E8C|nr:PREDICTED: BAHD acyltransferase At5g47980-like [Tarenaya hassleriana]